MTPFDGPPSFPAVAKPRALRSSQRGRPREPRLVGKALKQKTLALCRIRFMELQVEYGVTEPQTWDGASLGQLKLRIAEAKAEAEAQSIWRALREQLSAARSLLYERDERGRVIPRLQQPGLYASLLRRVLEPVRGMNFGGKAVGEPSESARRAILREFNKWNLLDLPPAPASRGGGGQALRAKDLAVVALLLDLWWPVQASVADTPKHVISTEADRFLELIRREKSSIVRGPRINSPRARRKPRAI